jgi:hypothetical protein
VTVGPFDEFKSFPPPAEGGAHVNQWLTLTDETALVAAKEVGVDVSLAKSASENQAAIDAYLQQNPGNNKNGGIGFVVRKLLFALDTIQDV